MDKQALQLIALYATTVAALMAADYAIGHSVLIAAGGFVTGAGLLAYITRWRC